jgi:hypothetical protein
MRFFPAPLLQDLVHQDRPLNVAADGGGLKEVQHRGWRQLTQFLLFGGHGSDAPALEDGIYLSHRFALDAHAQLQLVVSWHVSDSVVCVSLPLEIVVEAIQARLAGGFDE